MHVDELDIDEALVRRLLAEQFPEWAALPLSRVEPAGTVHAIFRLGDGLAVRLARRKGPTRPGGKDHAWLPRLAPQLPVEIPVPVAQGRPSPDYPWFWDIHTWVEGETVPVEEIDALPAARDLAALVAALQQIDPEGGPRGRGIPLAERDGEIRHWLARFDGDPRVTAEWERALAAPPWDGPPVWHHGDLDARNWLVRDGRISGVIDWGSMGIGDPACDVMVAWKLHSAAARDAFREALPTDDATWERARGWALSQAVAALAYYTSENNAALYREAESWLGADACLDRRELAVRQSYEALSELTWWLSPHPDWEPTEDWPEEVPVVRYETDDEVVLIDPFLPPDNSFDPHGKSVRVLLTQGAHYRGTRDFVERYGASVWAPPRAAWRKRPNPATTDELPRGVEAIELDGEPQQVVFFIREHRTLVTGDVLSGVGGGLHVFVDEADPERLLPSLDALAELPIERVIIPHGDLILSDGAARIRAAVAERRGF